MNATKTDRRLALLNAAAFCSLLAVLLLCYHQGFNGPFQLDDQSSVLPAKLESINIAGILKIIEEERSGFFGRAIPVVSFAINHHFGDGSAYGFKVTNFALHALMSVVVYSVLNIIFTVLHSQQSTLSRTDITKIALFCTAVWALHPLQISTVLYVVQRMAMLSALFSLVALWLFLIFRTRSLTPLSKPLVLTLIAISILAACLSKENGVLAFAYIGFVELVILRFRMPDGRLMPRYRRGFILATLLSIVAVAYLLLTLHAQLLSGYTIRDYGVQERLMSAPGVLLLYLKMILLPDLSQMAFFHDNYPVVREWGPTVFIPATELFLVLCVSLALYRKLPILLFGTGFFLLSHSMESTFLPLELVFEHRNYLSIIGVIAPLAWLSVLAMKSMKSGVPLIVASTGILALLCFQTYTRSVQWSDDEHFRRQALIDQPTSIRALNTWTLYLASKGRKAQLITHLQHSHQLRPDSPHFLLQLLIYTGIDIGPQKELLSYVREQVASKPFTIDETVTLSKMLENYQDGKARWPNLAVITELYQLATTHSQKRLLPPTESFLFSQYSSLLAESGHLQDAKIAAQHSVELDKTGLEPLFQLAKVQLELNEIEAVHETLQQLERIDLHEIYLPHRKAFRKELAQRTRLTSADSEN